MKVKKQNYDITLVNKLLILVLIVGSCLIGTAQETVSLTQAKQKLDQANLSIAYNAILVNQAKQAEKSSFTLDPTTVNLGLGQLNGAYADNSFGLIQNFQFPTVYSKKRNYLEQQTELALTQKQNIKAELDKQLELFFYDYEISEKQKQLLQFCDSIYAQAVTRQENRFKYGDINTVELGIFQQQRFFIYNELKQIEIDQNETQLNLQLLLNQSQAVIPKLPLDPLVMTTFEFELNNHPLLKVKEAEISVAEAKIENEKTRLLPSLTLEYANNSFKGTGSDDNWYNRSNRFHSIRAGVNIPLFTKARNDIQVLGLEHQANEQSYLIQELVMKQRIKQLENQIDQEQLLINYYQTKMLKPSVIFERIADQFEHGELNYIEFVTLVNQNIDQQNKFLQILRDYNSAVILYNYYKVN